MVNVKKYIKKSIKYKKKKNHDFYFKKSKWFKFKKSRQKNQGDLNQSNPATTTMSFETTESALGYPEDADNYTTTSRWNTLSTLGMGYTGRGQNGFFVSCGL